MTMKPPPDYFGPEACAAWRRIYESLVDRGSWDSCYWLALELAAFAVARYAELARIGPPVSAECLDEWRRQARASAVTMLCLDSRRVHLGPVDAHGHDAELLALVAPFDIEPPPPYPSAA